MKKKRKEKKRNERPDQYIYIYMYKVFSGEIGFVTVNVTKNTTSISTTTSVSVTTSFHRYFSHSATKSVSSLIVWPATPLATKIFVAKNLHF